MTKEDIKYLTEKYGQEFYIFNPKRFEDNYNRISRAFARYYKNFQVAYSYKTNYLPMCCKIVNRLGGYAEVVSEMELEIAHRCGVKDKRIIWNGPIKNANALEDFLLSGGVSNIDNYDEWKAIVQIVEKNKRNKINIGIRCNFEIGDGVLSRFGIDVLSEEFKQILEEISRYKNVVLFSIQCHFANRKPVYWKNRTKGMLEIYKMIIDNYHLAPKRVDLGGGLSGEMSEAFAGQLGMKKPEIDDYARNSAKELGDFWGECDDAPELVVEPGTALVADTMALVCRVENIRNIRGKWIATVSGSQKNISMQGINPPIRVVHMDDNNRHRYHDLDIAGYTCIESDYMFRGYDGEIAVGDYLIFDYCGSYSMVFKPPFINPNIPIIDYSEGEGQEKILKRRETVDDILDSFI